MNTTLEFDVTLFGHSAGVTSQFTRFQNNIQSIFSRVRLLYGSTPLEDIINYNVIVRSLTEWTATNQHMTMDQCSIAEGIGGIVLDTDSTDPGPVFGVCNVRQKYIHGISKSTTTSGNAAFVSGASFRNVPQNTEGFGATGNGTTGVTRRYQINFALGLFTQDKLIPTKFMASQLAVELSLASATDCIYSQFTGTSTASPTYAVGNVNLIPEILEFDASYDSMFLQGLRDGGVPIKFASWHTFLFSSSGSNANLLIQERSRSVKAIFAVQRRSTSLLETDAGATFFDTASNGASALQNFQFRIGGRYFPAAPVQCSTVVGGSTSNGGAEAYVELSKALNMVGDYRLSSSCNTNRWAIQATGGGGLPEYDYSYSLKYTETNGVTRYSGIIESATNSFCGTAGSGCFAMATDLETSNGVEISGLNAEEQSDISLLVNYKAAQVAGLEVYTYYDAMIVLRENNVLELIQ